MVRLTFHRARWRLLLGVAVILAVSAALPAAAGPRIWTLASLGLLAPWLVLGRDAVRAREGWRIAGRAPRGAALVLLELVPPLLVVGLGAALSASAAGWVLLSWGAAMVCVADALDRRWTRPGPAWVGLLVSALVLWTAPLWLAPWFGRTALAPWIASGSVAAHPAGAALAAAGFAALQDPVFYRFTLSGVVEARPLSGAWGASLFTTTALAGAAMAVRAARRPGRCTP